MELDGDDGLFRVFHLVWCLCLTENVSTSWNENYGYLFYVAFGAVVVACTGIFLSYFVKMAANAVSAVKV